MSNVRDAEQIKEILVARGITRLYHFTRLINLESIVENGLLTREQIREQELKSAFSDNRRWDDHPNATCCCSIEFPNYKMFYVVRRNHGAYEWVVIEISPDILLEKDCTFYPMNAAKSEFRNKDVNDFKGVEAFNAMFQERPRWTRAIAKIPESYTTNPQAEVLVFDQIEPKYILGIYTDKQNIADEWNAKEPKMELVVRGDVFDDRKDWKLWRY